jgi:hypothetical protein
MNKIIATVPRFLVLAATTTLAATPASGGVDLRVESRPIDGQIDAYIRVTGDDGRAITDLAKGLFLFAVGSSVCCAAGCRAPPTQGAEPQHGKPDGENDEGQVVCRGELVRGLLGKAPVIRQHVCKRHSRDRGEGDDGV